MAYLPCGSVSSKKKHLITIVGKIHNKKDLQQIQRDIDKGFSESTEKVKDTQTQNDSQGL